MNKQKRIIVTLAIICALLLCSVAFFAIREYLDYTSISFTVNDNLPDGEGRRATVILLGGQSNASGCARDEYLEKNVSAQKYEEYKNGYDNVYINYFSSGMNLSEGFVKCATLQGEAGGFFGPELGLAEKLNEMYPDELFFIIKYAWGGTNLYEQWLSPSSIGKTGQMYKEFERFTQISLDYLVSKNYDVKIEGMCWMQGESDSFSPENARNYKDNLFNLIKDVRAKFDSYSSDDGIAFIDAEIADNPVFWVYCDLVNASKRAVSDSSDMNVLIDTNSEGLICTEEPEEQPDIPHYDSMSEIKLGHLFAEKVAEFFD